MASVNWEDEDEFEVVNEDGFVYKRRKRYHLDPTASIAQKQKDPVVEEKNRLLRKKKVLMKIKDKYQNEINQWELLSNTLKEMQQQNQPKHQDSCATTALIDSGDPLVVSSDPTCRPLVDQLLVQDFGRPSTKTTLIKVQAWKGTSRGCNGPGLATVSGLHLWQMSQDEAYSCTSFFMRGQ
ncbi:uncharacterized protein LOC107860692 isoform X1 [Capsicum annuum]|uniref:uncharacterized protein LOC107860692 isoform X1 n=1 Tax=Capsicum annuum TaxID=4072 RepID=UPI0007BEDD23|nr:uncharacterized protein LOC107860692 isoform X1 [Capsicum annuum]